MTCFDPRLDLEFTSVHWHFNNLLWKLGSPKEEDVSRRAVPAGTGIGVCGSGCTSRGTEHFPEHDPAAVDAARFFFPSPGDAEYRADFTHTDLAVDMGSMPESDETALSRPENTLITRVSGAWDNNLIVTLSDGRKVRTVKLSSETPILCPFHNDITASAFVNFSEHSGNHFIYCSSCSKTFWHTEDDAVLERRLLPFWSVGKSVYEAGFTGDWRVRQRHVGSANGGIGEERRRPGATIFEWDISRCNYAQPVSEQCFDNVQSCW